MPNHVIVASQNPVKINAVRTAFNKTFPKISWKFEGISVPSGVSNQPTTDEETYNGAYNRATNAKNIKKTAQFWVGIEGGVVDDKKGMATFAWVVILSKNKIGKGKSATFFLPKKVAELIKNGKELGEADDIVFKKKNSKQANGAIGLLTHNLITRTTLYVPAVIVALIPFIRKDLY